MYDSHIYGVRVYISIITAVMDRLERRDRGGVMGYDYGYRPHTLGTRLFMLRSRVSCELDSRSGSAVVSGCALAELCSLSFLSSP